MRWGSYPMAPFAGRIRHGRFAFRGTEHRLPLGMPPHAIHGVAWDRPWRVDDPTTLSIDLDDRWPFRGRVVQRFALDEESLRVELTLEAAEAMPATIGWHPWFRRFLVPGDPSVTVDLDADEMLVRDGEGIPSGERMAPPPGPWDDAFTGVHGEPTLTWPGRLRLRAVIDLRLVDRLHRARARRVRRAPERAAGRRQRHARGRGARRAARPRDALALGPAGLSPCRYGTPTVTWCSDRYVTRVAAASGGRVRSG